MSSRTSSSTCSPNHYGYPTYKIVSQNLNIHHLVPTSKDKEARVAKFLQKLLQKQPDCDILLLQEVFVLNTVFWRVGAELRNQIYGY